MKGNDAVVLEMFRKVNRGRGKGNGAFVLEMFR